MLSNNKPKILPKQHPSYHRNTMLVCFALMIPLMGIGWLLADSPEKDLGYLEIIAACLSFNIIFWIGYRIFFAKLRCPNCKTSMKYLGKYIDDLPRTGINKHWNLARSRHFKCKQCTEEYIIPLISED